MNNYLDFTHDRTQMDEDQVLRLIDFASKPNCGSVLFGNVQW